jgi:hypothetical protein
VPSRMVETLNRTIRHLRINAPLPTSWCDPFYYTFVKRWTSAPNLETFQTSSMYVQTLPPALWNMSASLVEFHSGDIQTIPSDAAAQWSKQLRRVTLHGSCRWRGNVLEDLSLWCPSLDDAAWTLEHLTPSMKRVEFNDICDFRNSYDSEPKLAQLLDKALIQLQRIEMKWHGHCDWPTQWPTQLLIDREQGVFRRLYGNYSGRGPDAWIQRRTVPASIRSWVRHLAENSGPVDLRQWEGHALETLYLTQPNGLADVYQSAAKLSIQFLHIEQEPLFVGDGYQHSALALHAPSVAHVSIRTSNIYPVSAAADFSALSKEVCGPIFLLVVGQHSWRQPGVAFPDAWKFDGRLAHCVGHSLGTA